jgi:hypothetical protein
MGEGLVRYECFALREGRFDHEHYNVSQEIFYLSPSDSWITEVEDSRPDCRHSVPLTGGGRRFDSNTER